MKSAGKGSVVALVILGMVLSGYRAEAAGSKSLRKALLLSLLIPGTGQAYLGHGKRAKAMMVSEVGVWSAFALFRVQGSMREDRYREMAGIYAGVEGDRTDDYYEILAYYMSSEDYNIDILREARFRYPDNPQDQWEYFQSNGYFGEDAWEWESVTARHQYAYTRTLSRRSYRRAVLTTGFAVLNRMVSMIDVYLSFRLGRVGQKGSLPVIRLGSGPDRSYRLYLSTSF